jgi:hypothetical protein
MKALECVNHMGPSFSSSCPFEPPRRSPPDPDQMRVERRGMQGTQRNAVWDRWNTERIRIGENVSGFEQFVATQPAHGAMVLIGADNALAKFALMQALLK